MEMPLKAAILAGGLGLRLRPLTDDRPKTMVQVNGISIAERILKSLTTIGVDEAIFACGHKWEKIKEAFGDNFNGMKISYSVETTALGTSGALAKVITERHLTDEGSILVCNGDVLSEFDLHSMLKWHETTHPTVTILAVPFKSPYGVLIMDKLRTIREFKEKPVFEDKWINGGWYVIDPRRLHPRLVEVGSLEIDVFPKLTGEGEIQGHPYYGFWRGVDTIKDLQEAEKEFLAE